MSMLSDDVPNHIAGHRSIALVELLGTGRHGSVFRATQGPARAPVAVKIPIDDDAADAEARALRRFAHPHVVRLLDGPLDNGALVLEPCTSTLADRTGSTAPGFDELALVGRGLLDALDHIHRLGWVHGDVTPANIGLRSDGTAALLDFATARPIGDGQVTEGTPEFLGELRRPTPPLDLRAAAACLRTAVCPTRWTSEPADLVDSLDAFIARADAGRPVTSDELRVLLDLPEAPPGPNVLVPASSPGLPRLAGVPRTTSFGPRPSRAAPAAVRVRLRPRRALVAALIALAVVLASAELWNSRSATPVATAPASETLADPSPRAVASAGQLLAAVDSLARHDAVWDTVAARLTIGGPNGLRHIDVGQPGDQVAIADWNCEGTSTLGLYRPRSGAFYVFSSWGSATPAGPPIDLEPGGNLTVAVDDAGCASPRL